MESHGDAAQQALEDVMRWLGSNHGNYFKRLEKEREKIFERAKY